MATVILVRHGRTTANASGVLAGRSAGVGLDSVGRQQAARVGARLATLNLARIVTSPLRRCRQTARAIEAQQSLDSPAGKPRTDARLSECDYGRWQGRPLAELAKEELWAVVQRTPSAVTFPGGESMPAMQARAVAAIRAHDAQVEAAVGKHAVWAAVSHGDIIKSVLADALGMHLDLFQRIDVHPASVSVIRFHPTGAQVVSMNSDSGDLGWLGAAPTSTDTQVGGGNRPPSS
ncbi:MAG: MSMEG_4193 family putative phosphomutase [Beutenbergiaceae bacterium]